MDNMQALTEEIDYEKLRNMRNELKSLREENKKLKEENESLRFQIECNNKHKRKY